MSRNRILIVDDEPDIRDLLEITLIRMGLDCDKTESARSARSMLEKNQYDLCLTDMNLGADNGFDVIQHIQELCPQTPVAVITAYSNADTAVEAMKAGAFDYVAKPIDLPKLRSLVNSALKLTNDEINSQEQEPTSTQLIGKSESIIQLRKTIQKVARSLAPVFIQGESGSGKEMVARLIHQQSSRSSKPFIAVNCGAIPSELMESEFFGHQKGSFTGATENKDGLFRAAQGGTLFLDEVADLPKDMQVKLLRAIQEKSIRPVGANDEIPVDVRILSATHKDLSHEVSENNFRQDLFYRINVIEMFVASLRERREDIDELCQFMLKKLGERYETETPTLTNSALKKLKQYDFPGNVRELENILERAFTMCDGNEISEDDLILTTTIQSFSHSSKPSSDNLIDISMAIGNYDKFIEETERQILENALEHTRWNKTAAAELLGISFRTIRYKLKKLGID